VRVHFSESKSRSCRFCGKPKIIPVLDLGKLSLTGVFLFKNENVPSADLVLSQCSNCKLVQLQNSYPTELLYSSNYGYESHLNSTMTKHLQSKARILEKKYLDSNAINVVVDIASNDGTFLSGFESDSILKIGIDPLINIVGDYYPTNCIKIADYFSTKTYWKNCSFSANIVTSMSVIYDLEDPVKFAQEVSEILSEGGIWHFEQSYLPLMVESTSYDTICHEHLLYLTLHDIQFMLKKAGMKLIDVTLNSINGGSIAVTAKKSSAVVEFSDPFIDFLLERERFLGFQDGTALSGFVVKSYTHRQELRKLILDYRNSGYRIIGLGASTKGNVLLQWAGLNSQLIEEIGDVNPKKFGKVTPGTNIPIVPETEALQTTGRKTIALVLPWHFRANILERSEIFLSNGGKLLFPLPNIEVVSY